MAEQHESGRVPADACIGIFDSGLGGLSVLREITRLLPAENIFYFADSLHLPYGPRPLDEVRRYAAAIAGRLVSLPAKAVVVACNTASAASLKYLREIYPDTPFIGMEPAVKPAAAGSRSGLVGVLATQATFQGELFESVVDRFAAGVEVIRQPCPGLAEFIENHQPDHPVLEAMLRKFIGPLAEKGADTIVLACTHYALVRDTIQAIAGPDITILDPSPAIARRTEQVLREAGSLSPAGGKGRTVFSVSGEPEHFSRAASRILGREVAAERSVFSWIPVNPDDASAVWHQGQCGGSAG